MSVLYREHRGGYEESMATVREILSLSEIEGAVKIKPYCVDYRNDWTTYIVLDRDNNPLGFTNGMIG